ncbi:hypothetical protein CDIK_3626, partial [Cucumispora dikerogammari]
GEMKKLKHIKLLNLENVCNQKKSICQLLRHVDSIFIQSLCISHVYLPWELPADLCNLLDKAKNIEYLKETNFNLRTDRTICLLKRLVYEKSKLRYLNMSYNNIIRGVGKIDQLINKISSLEILKMKSNSFSEMTLNDILKHIKQVSVLDLTNIKLSPQSCLLLGRLFGKFKIKKLKLYKCNIGIKVLLNF